MRRLFSLSRLKDSSRRLPARTTVASRLRLIVSNKRGPHITAGLRPIMHKQATHSCLCRADHCGCGVCQIVYQLDIQGGNLSWSACRLNIYCSIELALSLFSSKSSSSAGELVPAGTRGSLSSSCFLLSLRCRSVNGLLPCSHKGLLKVERQSRRRGRRRAWTGLAGTQTSRGTEENLLKPELVQGQGHKVLQVSPNPVGSQPQKADTLTRGEAHRHSLHK